MSRVLGVLGPLTAGMLLVACSTSGGSTLSGLFKSDKPVADVPQDYFMTRGYCPPVQIRGGTGVFVSYERGHESDRDFIRHQASITRTARECSEMAGSLSLRVGVGGRVVAGPKGVAGEISLPLRIAVSRQGQTDVIFSQLYKVPVTLAPPDLGADFQQVITTTSFPMAPGDKDIIVYVGFDEGKPG